MTADPSVVLASAGSGKTYELAGRYINALDRSHGKPERILATTFTRKAAGEMLAKVLDRLIDLTKRETKNGSDLGLSPERATMLALTLVRNIDRVRVQTLDSYFAEIGRFGAGELGLTPGWRILDEVEIDESRERAIDVLCRTLDANSFLSIIETINRGALPMLPRAELLRRAVDLHQAFIDSGGSNGKWGVIKAEASSLLDRGTFRALLAEFQRLPPVHNKSGEPNKKFAGGRSKAEALADSGVWDEFSTHTLVKAAEQGIKYCGADVPIRMGEILVRLARHASAAAVLALASASRAAGVLVLGFDRAFNSVKREANTLMFDDLPRLMLSLSPEERDWVSFRMDGKVDHLLLDEFQDTSRVQYLVMEPMLREISAGGEGALGRPRSIFAVGDLKQSLYSWRGAVPELLEGLSGRLMLGAPATRARSWRSSQAVLDAVNQVFGSLDSNPELSGNSAVVKRWCGGFSRHEAARDLDGFASLEQVRAAEEGEDRVDLVIDRAVERVREISGANPNWSVAVLTRTNGVIPRVIHRLKKVNIRAAQERGHPLMDEPCVGAVVSLLQLSEHPGDSASQFHVAKTSLAPLVGMISPLDKSVGSRVAAETRERIGRDGLSGLVAWLRSQLADALSARANNRMEHLERIAHDFDAKASGRIPEFIRLVQETAVVDPPDGEVSVLTVHMAKGLEWDAVVLIDLERNWKARPPAVVVDRGLAGETDPLAPVEAISLWPSEALQACDPRLAAMAERWHGRGLREAMSGLYVAMTRAKHRLEMIVANETEPRISLCSSKVLRAAVGSPSLGNKAGELLRWEHKAVVKNRTDGKTLKAPTTKYCELKFTVDKTEIRSGAAPSSKAEASDVRAILRDPIANRDARRRGDIWHAWMETVEWAENWKTTDEELIAVAVSFGCPEPEAREQVDALRKAISGPIGGALRKTRYAGRAETLRVEREWSLAWMDVEPNPGLVSGRVDRVVIGLNGGKPAWAEVLDFKTDKVNPENVAESVDSYRSQIASYRRAVARALGLPLERIEGTLFFLRPAVIADVFADRQNSEG